MAWSSLPGLGGAGGRRSGAVRREKMRAAARRPSWALRQLRDAVRKSALAVAAEPAPVFVSYSHDDSVIVGELVAFLREEGVAVTWDQDIAAGKDLERAIRDAIEVAPAVIVVWSGSSVRSAYVRGEATLAAGRNKVVTTQVSGFDFAEVPLNFTHLNAIPVDDRGRLVRSLEELGVRVGSKV